MKKPFQAVAVFLAWSIGSVVAQAPPTPPIVVTSACCRGTADHRKREKDATTQSGPMIGQR